MTHKAHVQEPTEIQKGLERLGLDNEGLQTQEMDVAVDPLSVNLPEAVSTVLSRLDKIGDTDDADKKRRKRIAQRLRDWVQSALAAGAGYCRDAKKALTWVSALLLLLREDADIEYASSVFRPLLIDLVARWVEAEAPIQVFGEIADDEMGLDDIPERVAYVGGALARNYPQIKRLLMAYFEKSGTPYFRQIVGPSRPALDSRTWRRVMLASYRLLMSMPEIAASDSRQGAWAWRELLYKAIDKGSQDSFVRYLAVECLHLLSAAGGATGGSIVGEQEKERLLQRLIPVADERERLRVQIVLGEEVRVKRIFNDMIRSNAEWAQKGLWGGTGGWILDDDLSGYTVNVGGVLLPRATMVTATGANSSASSGASAGGHHLVYTPTTVRNLRQMALAVSLRSPIQLVGLTGSGKSALIEELARMTGNELITIHLGDQTDSKVLLGTYVTTEKPGHFEWQPGVLTVAVKTGKWVAFEDIDLAPGEVVSVLVPLLESGELFIPSRGERIRAHNQFMLFATRTLVPAPSLMSAQAAHDGRDIRIKGVKRSGGSTTTEAMLASNVWTKVELEPLGRAELVQVIREGRYAKNLGGAAEMLVSVYDRIRGHNGVARGSPAGRDSGRFVSTRDLLKWCRRIDMLITNHQNSNDLLMAGQSGRDLLALEIGRQWLFEEAADVFCGMEPGYDAWICMLRAIGVSALGIPEQRVLHYAQKEMPEFERSTSSAIIKIGRCILRRRPRAAHEATVGNERPFAETRHSRKLMEKIAVSVSLNEPLLLVGETGTGKTTVVQRLADIMGEKLVVINLSQQSDSSDLLGGFKPVDIRMLLVPIKDEFEELFAATFSTKSNAAYLDAVRGAFGKRNWKRTVRLFKEACGRAEKVIAKYRKSAQESDAGDRMGSSFDAVGRKRREDGLPFAAATAEAGASKKKKKVAATSGRLRMDPSELERRWSGLRSQVTALESQLFAPGGGQQQAASHSMAFSFVVGALVHAVKRGYWVLLDEINLATPETLESLSGLLQSPTGSLMLTERGDIRPLPRHPGFRVFACMNPATDVGKRDLPPGLRNRFTEFYVHSPDSTGNESDLLAVVECYLNQFVRTSPTLSNRVVEFYRLAKHLASRHSIVDGAGQRPHYSLRTLSRALTFARDNAAVYSIHRALYDGLYMTFVTQLDRDCQSVLDAKLREVLFQEQSNVQALLDKAPAQPPPRPTTSPAHADNPPFVRYGGFWLATGPLAINPEDTCHYVITSSVERQLSALARAVMCGKYPVLIQGPTSAGKTSMVEYLARETGHKFVRINNHEHTDLQEYVGSYVSRDDGRLEFKEGLLVTALREGHWIVLDELNLAPTDVLEALNRLLDDNRELLIPETQETVRPHPHFRLFATQNPAGLYGGRKALSRAFRNRFLEFHFSELPMDELETILITRCQIAPSYAKKLVAVYRRLTDERQQSRMFEARHGFITLRDLFRWAMRGDVGYQQLAESGYMLLAERVRKKEEKLVVKRVLEETMKVKLDEDDLYSVARLEAMPEYQEYARLHCREVDGRGSVPLLAWTRAMRRLFMLTSLCLRFHEPVLLVGETGCGKTTVCQVLAMVKGRELKMVNCHQNTETSDLLGGQRPVRDRVRLVGEARDGLAGLIRAALEECSNSNVSETAVDVEGLAGMTLPELQDLWARLLEAPDTGDAIRLAVTQSQELAEQFASVNRLLARANALFEWRDGPLVQAMKSGDLFLLDEISLADDSVLERLNSILETSRSLMLAEDASGNGESIVAAPNFEFLATMNPGGDYGKRELSPALRNRFTELWVPAISSRADLELILYERLWDRIQAMGHGYSQGKELDLSKEAVGRIVRELLDYVMWLAKTLVPGLSGGGDESELLSVISLRDYLAWTDFIARTHGWLGVAGSFAHGGCLVILDGIGSHSALGGAFGSYQMRRKVKARCVDELLRAARSLVGGSEPFAHDEPVGALVGIVEAAKLVQEGRVAVKSAFELGRLVEFAPKVDGAATGVDIAIGIPPFMIDCGNATARELSDFSLQAPTTFDNLVRLLRGMQIPKPILLEGSPGVGKTSLVSALANLSGHHLVRINLSDQTDLMDLFGSDLPVEGGKPGEFVWRDAPFLQAMQSGHWVLLDEINLASQSVLEGLNACLDHRGTVYVSELDKSFSQHPGFRVFAAQNPIQQGGGRKGLPKSFVNRFTQVYFDELNRDDMMMICQNLFAASFGRASDDPSSAARDDVARRILGQVLAFNDEVYRETMVTRRFGREGSPWEFNLRDVLRWLEISVSRTPSMQFDAAVRYFVRMLYVDRMRNPADRQHVADLYHRVFGDAIADLVKGNPHYTITPARIQVGGAVLDRRAVAQRPLTGGVSSLRLLRHQLRPLESAMHCLSMSWMPILIGKSGVGKTSLVRWLAATAGYPLVEFSMNTGVDTMELLGGFEQVDLFRHFEHVRQRIYALIKRIEQEILASRSGPAQQSKLAELGQLLMRLHADSTVTRSRSGSEGADGGHPDFKAARLALEDICRFATDNGPLAAIDGSGGSIVAEAEAIDRHLEVCRDMAARGVSGQFEWVDGVLVEALEKGHWLLVDQANLCNPSVLDRLNGLLEPRGVLVVNERGMVGGQIKIISPHPDFRIIMTMDPSAGELSRAMRNRGIEIVMHEPTLDDGEVLDWILDVASANGIHDMPLAANLLRVIDKQTRLESHIGDSRAVSCSLTRDYSLLCRLVAEKVQRGVQLSHDLLLSTPIDGKARSGSDDRVMQEFYGWLNRLPSFSQINSCTLQESLLTTLLAEFAGAASGSGDDRAAARLLAAVALATRYTLDDGGDDDDDDAGSSGPWWVKSFRAQVGHLRSMLHGSLAAAARGSSSGCANEKIDKVVEFITEPHPLIEAAVSLVKKQLRGNEVPLVTIPVDVGKVSETSLASNISRTLSAWFISYHCAESLDEARELGHLTDAPGSGSAAQVQGLTHLQLAYLYTASHGQQVLSTQLNHPVLTVVYPLLEATRDLAYRWVDYLAGEATSDASPSMRDEGIYHRLTTTVETVMSIRRQMWDKLAAVRGIRSPVNISYLSACGEWMRDALDNVTDIAGVLSDDVGTALGNVTGHLQAFQAALDQGNGTQVARIIWERNHPITLLDSELRKLEVKLTTQAARLATAAAGDDEESSEWVVQGLATIYALADKSAREHRANLLATLGQVAERLEDKLAPVSKAGPDAAGGDSGENNTEGAPAAVTPSAFLGRLLVLARQHSNNRMLDIIASGLSLSQAADSTELAGAVALTAFRLMRPILARLSTAHVSGYDWDRSIAECLRLVHNQRLAWLAANSQYKSQETPTAGLSGQLTGELRTIMTDATYALQQVQSQPVPLLSVDTGIGGPSSQWLRIEVFADDGDAACTPAVCDLMSAGQAILTPLVWGYWNTLTDAPIYAHKALTLHTDQFLRSCLNAIDLAPRTSGSGDEAWQGIVETVSHLLCYVSALVESFATAEIGRELQSDGVGDWMGRTMSEFARIVANVTSAWLSPGSDDALCGIGEDLLRWWQPLETGGGLGRELLVRCHDLISGASASSDSFGVQTWLLARAIKLFDSVIPASTHRSALPCTDSLDDAEFSLLTAQAATTVSLLMLVASIPASPIDPSTKIAAYWDWLNSRKSALKADLVSHRLIERYRAGNFSDETSSTRKKITEAIDETDRQMAKAQLQIVYRPLLSDAATTTSASVNDAYSFRSLWQEARRLIETGGPLDPRRLEEIFSTMRSLHDSAGSCGKGPALVEKRSQTLQSHLVQVERRLRVHYFDGFRDVAQVWLVWINRIREGLRRCTFAARRRCVFDSDITRRVYSTVSCWLPSYPLALAVARGTDGSADHNNSSSSNEWRELTDPRTLVAIKHALLSGRDARAAGASRGMSLYSRLLVLLLDHTRYLAAVTGYLDCDVLASMEGILAEVHNVWQWAESERKKKEAEANSLYKIREHENEDLDDAKIAERELNALFPSFDDDFQLTTGDAVDELNDVYPGKVQGERESQDSAATGRTVSGFDDGALRRLVELHGAILARFSTNSCQPLGLDSDSDSDHHDQKPQPQPQLAETGIATHSWRAQQILALTKQSQKIASLIFRSINKQSWSTPSAGTDNLTYDVPVGSPVDSRLGVSHAVALAIQHLESTQQPTLHGDTAPPGQLSEVDATSKKARVRASERPYNFYRDPNVVEAAKVPEALGPLNSRISQLLAAWPDHPVLLQIRELIDRILSFPAATSSVAKLLTGFEMLFQKASLDWQAYASRDVSIKDELARVSSQIIHWRQLELNTWPHLLRAQEVEAEQSVDKWWFHLYSSLVAPFPSAGGEVTEVGDGGQQALAPESAVRLVDQFLQMCPVGEFAVRLGMLSSFHNHLLIRESVHPDTAQQQLAFTLDNCIRHYTQFLPVLAAHLSQHRAPIARDLAEFVKISTWRDVNPAALRESAQKTHRHLSKHIRRWKAVLSQPVNQIIEADIVQYISVAAESDRWTADPHSICGSDSQDKRKKKRRQRKGKGKSNGMPRDSQRDGSNGGGFRSVSLAIYDVAATAATVPDRITQQANCWASDRGGAESTLREFDKVFEVIQRRCQQEPELGQPISWQLYRVISDNGPTESDGGPHAGIRQYTDRLVQLGIDVMQIINRFQTMQLPSEIANKADLMLVAKHKEGDCDGSSNDAKAKVAAKPKKGKRVVTLKGLPNDDENGGSDNHKEITEEEAREAQKVAVRNFWAHQRQIKQKTITDLLKELKRLGLNPRFSPRNTLALSKSDPALSVDKHSKAESDKDIGHLLLPTLAIHDWIQVTRHLAPVDAPTGFFHDGIGEATRLYRMSDRAFYEAHLLYQRLRAEAISPSPASPVDLTPDQIERVVGTMSHALHLLTEERKSGVEAMSQALRWMKLALMWQDSRYNDNDDGNASGPADRQPADSELGGAARLVAVKRLVDHAEELLTEIAVSVNTTCRAVDPSNVNGEKRRWLDQHLFPVVETLRALKKRISGVVARMVLAPRSALAGGLAGKGGTASTLVLVLTGRNFPVISSIHADFVQAMARVGKLVADTRGLSADRDSQMMAPWVGDTLMAFVNQALTLAGTRHSPFVASTADGQDKHGEASADVDTGPQQADIPVHAPIEQVSRLLTAIRLVLQGYLAECREFRDQLSTARLSSTDGDGESGMELADNEVRLRTRHYTRLLRLLQLPKMTELLVEAARTCGQNNEASLATSWILANRIRPLVGQYTMIVQHTIARFVLHHTNYSRWTTTMLRVFASVLHRGIRSPAEQSAMEEDGSEEAGEGAGTGQFETGTGIGEDSIAEGAKNVSDEIENEEQVLGTMDQQEQQPSPDQPKPKTDEEAIEMENDFNGELDQADLETDHDDDDENGDEDREDDLDEQLGEVDFDDPTAMDEKLWESSGDEDDGGEDDGSGRRESEQQVEKKASRGKKDQELVAAEEEADPTEADSHSEEKADANQQEEDGKCDAEDAEDAEDETEQEDADERPQDDANYPPPLADVEDAGEQFDLPDDLDLGEYDADKDDGERDNGPDDAMEIEDDDKDAGAEDNQASPKEDVNEGSDAHQEASQEEEEGDQEDVVPGRDELAPAEEGEKDQQVEEHEKAEEEDQLIKPEGDKEPEYPQDHEEPSPDDDAAKAEGEDEASDENEQQPHHPPPPDERPSQPNAYGVEADKGKPSGDSQPLVSTADNNSSGGSGGGHEERRQEESALPNNAQPAGGNSQGPDSHQPRSAADGAKQQQQESLSASDEAQELQDKDVNPLRSLSDAIEQWQRRLRISEHTQDGEANEGEGVGQVEEQQPAVDANVEYEFVKDEEKHTAVGMADAEDEEQLRHNDDEGWKDREQRQADAMEIEHQEQEESGKSAQQNDASASEARMHLLQSLSRDEGGEGQDPGQKHDDEAASEDQKATLQSAAVADQRALLETDSMELERESVNEDPHILRPEESHGAQRSLEELREELERLIAEWHSEGNDRDMQLAASLWQKYQQATHDLSMVLTEQLRLVLAPTLATQLRGDYRTGRRLNMKRIIPYIASQFKKDKIWLRRTKPSKRQYQVMIAVDDSKSMASGGSTRSVELAYEALALITSSLNHLEVGQISILSFGERVRLLHPFDATFDQSAGARVLQQFTFNQDKTNVAELLNTSIQIFNEAKQSASAAAINPDLWQLQLIISDGVCEDHPRLRQLVRAAVEHRIMMVFVVIDQLGRQQGKPAPTAGSNALPSDSIMNIQRVRYVTASDGRMVLKMDRYLDTFPFDYYVVLRDIQGLPGVLADALRQYFSLVGTD